MSSVFSKMDLEEKWATLGLLGLVVGVVVALPLGLLGVADVVTLTILVVAVVNFLLSFLYLMIRTVFFE